MWSKSINPCVYQTLTGDMLIWFPFLIAKTPNCFHSNSHCDFIINTLCISIQVTKENVGTWYAFQTKSCNGTLWFPGSGHLYHSVMVSTALAFPFYQFSYASKLLVILFLDFICFFQCYLPSSSGPCSIALNRCDLIIWWTHLTHKRPPSALQHVFLLYIFSF